MGPIQGDIRHPLDLRPRTIAAQPFRNLFIFWIIHWSVKNTVDRGSWHAAVAQNAGRFVGGGQNRQGTPILARARLIVSRDDIHACVLQRMI